MSDVKNLNIHVAELVACDEPSVVSTVLGSCVSVCIFSEKLGVGGMTHFALPEAPADKIKADEYRYGDTAVTALIRELTKMTGKEPSVFSAKIVGGANDPNEANQSSKAVGLENIKIAKSLLKKNKIPIVGESLGGTEGKKVLFHIPSGRLQVAKLISTENKSTPTAQGKKTAPVAAAIKPKKVLIVDDSKTIQTLLTRILKEDSSLSIMGIASDPIEAAALIAKEKPDVITLDIHMPRMTGVEWLEELLPVNPIPVVMISSLQMAEGNEVMRALELGAVDYIQKPSLQELGVVGPLIREKVKSAAFSKVLRHKINTYKPVQHAELDLHKILAIGASTGGTEALKNVLCALPEVIPPTVIVQHIPPVFSKAFADRVNQLVPFEVKEAEDGDELKTSRVLIAPGGKQMKLQKTSTGYCVRINDDPPMNRHKPSVDYLFHSVAALVGKKAVGVILTGMGADGAKGLLDMKNHGAQTIGQDEESCVVYGMPKAAFELGGVQQQASLYDIPNIILRFLSSRKSA